MIGINYKTYLVNTRRVNKMGSRIIKLGLLLTCVLYIESSDRLQTRPISIAQAFLFHKIQPISSLYSSLQENSTSSSPSYLSSIKDDHQARFFTHTTNLHAESNRQQQHRLQTSYLTRDSNLFSTPENHDSDDNLFGCPSECECNKTTLIADCSNKNLNKVPTIFPKDIKRISLQRNNITELGAHAFQGLKRLQRVDLSNNNLARIDSLAFAGGLQSLNSLILYSNKLTQLPVDLFNELGQLQLLLLNDNSIQCIHKELFQPLENLNLLSLYDNNIETLSNGTFDGLKNIKTIHLGKNPLVCDCNLRWLADYLELRPAIETSEARCDGKSQPARNQGKKLNQVNKQKFKCEGNESGRINQCSVQQQDQACPPGCNCLGATVDCSRSSAGQMTESRVGEPIYALPDVPDNVPVFVAKMKINDPRIKKIRQTGLFKRLASSQKLLPLQRSVGASPSSPAQHVRVLNAFEQYCAAYKRKLTADRLQPSNLDNDLDLGNNIIVDIEDNAVNGGPATAKPERVVFILLENSNCDAGSTNNLNNKLKQVEDACSSAPRVNPPNFDSPCYNGGSCVSRSVNTRLAAPLSSNYTCFCPPGFSGQLCEINIDDCAEHQCQNGALCVDGINSYKCICRDPSTTGEYCEQLNASATSSANSIAPMALPIVASSNQMVVAEHPQLLSRSVDSSHLLADQSVGESNCKRITKRRYFSEENGCQSVRLLKMSECVGYCPSSSNYSPADTNCCQVAKVKRRRIRMQCSDGASYVKTIDLVKKCTCSNQCNHMDAANHQSRQNDGVSDKSGYNSTQVDLLLQTTRFDD